MVKYKISELDRKQFYILKKIMNMNSRFEWVIEDGPYPSREDADRELKELQK